MERLFIVAGWNANGLLNAAMKVRGIWWWWIRLGFEFVWEGRVIGHNGEQVFKFVFADE